MYSDSGNVQNIKQQTPCVVWINKEQKTQTEKATIQQKYNSKLVYGVSSEYDSLWNRNCNNYKHDPISISKHYC